LDRVRLIDVSSGRSWPLGQGNAMAVFTSDGARAYVTLLEYTLTKLASTLKAFDNQGKEVATLGTLKDRGYSSPQLSVDGKRLAVSVRVAPSGERVRDPHPRDYPQPRVFLFDLTKKGGPEEIVCPHGWNGGLAFSADDKTLAVGGAGAVHLFDVSKAVK